MRARWSPSGTTRRPSGVRRARSPPSSVPSRHRRGERTEMASSTRYDVYDTTGKLLRSGVCAAKAGEMMELDGEEVVWAVEEFGLCDNEMLVVIEKGEPFP